jgi:hypothetical protein
MFKSVKGAISSTLASSLYMFRKRRAGALAALSKTPTLSPVLQLVDTINAYGTRAQGRVSHDSTVTRLVFVLLFFLLVFGR